MATILTNILTFEEFLLDLYENFGYTEVFIVTNQNLRARFKLLICYGRYFDLIIDLGELIVGWMDLDLQIFSRVSIGIYTYVARFHM